MLGLMTGDRPAKDVTPIGPNEVRDEANEAAKDYRRAVMEIAGRVVKVTEVVDPRIVEQADAVRMDAVLIDAALMVRVMVMPDAPATAPVVMRNTAIEAPVRVTASDAAVRMVQTPDAAVLKVARVSIEAAIMLVVTMIDAARVVPGFHDAMTITEVPVVAGLASTAAPAEATWDRAVSEAAGTLSEAACLKAVDSTRSADRVVSPSVDRVAASALAGVGLLIVDFMALDLEIMARAVIDLPTTSTVLEAVRWHITNATMITIMPTTTTMNITTHRAGRKRNTTNTHTNMHTNTNTNTNTSISISVTEGPMHIVDPKVVVRTAKNPVNMVAMVAVPMVAGRVI